MRLKLQVVTINKTPGGLAAIKPKIVLKKKAEEVSRPAPSLLFRMNMPVLTKILIWLHFKEIFELRDDGAELLLDGDALPDPKRQLTHDVRPRVALVQEQDGGVIILMPEIWEQRIHVEKILAT